jgi:hypothetical protein
MNFNECLIECCKNTELVNQFNRLQGTNISFQDKRVPIEKMIDETTGYDNPFKNSHEDMMKFFDFVFEYVWLPLVYENENIVNVN